MFQESSSSWRRLREISPSQFYSCSVLRLCVCPILKHVQIRDIVEDGILEVTGECPDRASGVDPGIWPRWMLQDVEDDLDLKNNRLAALSE